MGGRRGSSGRVGQVDWFDLSRRALARGAVEWGVGAEIAVLRDFVCDETPPEGVVGVGMICWCDGGDDGDGEGEGGGGGGVGDGAEWTQLGMEGFGVEWEWEWDWLGL